MTILGTRPEIIRLSRIIPKLDQVCAHVLVHTGQNYDNRLSDVFFEELGIRSPDHYLGVKADSFGQQIGNILVQSQRIFEQEQPDKLLLLGDTNSALSAIIAKRMGIPVYHMEAGNRCYDDRVPEEVNRRVIDHSSDFLMPYTERSRANLLREGIAGNRIFVTGNPIFEVLQHYEQQVSQSGVLDQLYLEPQRYFLVTMHREENVDVEERLRGLVRALDLIQQEYQVPVIYSLHPRARNRLEKFGVQPAQSEVRLHEPFGLFDFVSLEKNALCVLSDSGTVQEECAIFRVPTVTIRDVTERPETLEAGSNILSGADPGHILTCARTVLSAPPSWQAPPEYLVPNVSETVVRILIGHHETRH